MKMKFASAGRSSAQEIEQDFHDITTNPCSRYFAGLPLPLIILNSNRQIVFANDAFVNTLRLKGKNNFLGQRPGEALQCIYANKGPGGCGTSEYCQECGGVRAILQTIVNDESCTQDIQLLQFVDGDHKALDLRIHATPFEFGESQFYMITIMDITAEKEREVMERVFFHDILNSAGSARNLLEMLCAESTGEIRESLQLLHTVMKGMVDDIETHRELRMAEKGEYLLSLLTIQSLELITNVADEFGPLIEEENKTLQLGPETVNVPLKTDYSLLHRVLVNMLKNALEATPEGGMVRIGCHLEGKNVVFEVWNDQPMDRTVQLQVFKRFFSTKGNGRGLGTYSIKFLTENYLGGKADFQSDEKTGTIFRVTLPASL